MATIKDIADKAGVSTATVSRVINGNDRVNPALRASILSAMEQMSYFPNTVARSLKTESTMSIGVVIQDLSNHHIAAFCNSLESVVSPAGYLPVIASTNNNPQLEEKFLRHMLERRVDALVVHSGGYNNKLIADISKRIPTVSLYRRVSDPRYRGDHVDNENYTSVYRITRHLLECGHRRIFIINGPQNISTGTERFEGFRSAMREFGIEVDERYPYRFDSNFMTSGGFEGCERLLGLAERPTALVATNPEILVGALSCLNLRGVRVPDDLSVVSFSRPMNMALFYIDITSSTEDPQLLGLRAGSLLLERLRAPDLPNREIIFPSPVGFGNSVKRLCE